MVHFQVRPLTTFVLAALLRCLAISLAVVPVGSVASALAQSGAGFTSPTTLLLKQSSLPRGFRYRGSFVQRSVERWDGDIAPVLAIDEQNGWLIAAQESALDRAGRTVTLSVQLFTTDAGAGRDFGQFFTNQHPQTRFIPGTSWQGGTPVRGLGDRATLYHILDRSSSCPRHLTAGLSFVYRNGIFSVGVCQIAPGDPGARDLARRLFARAKRVGVSR